MRLPITLAATLAFLAIAVTGCGGDDGATADDTGDNDYTVQASTTMAPASPELSKAEFLKYINKVCRQAWVTLGHNWDVYSRTQESKLGEKEKFANNVQESLLAGIDFHIFDDIHMTGSPRGEEETVERIIGPMQEAVELGQLRRWTAHSVPEIVSHFAVYNERAQAYGLDDCLVNEAHLQPIKG